MPNIEKKTKYGAESISVLEGLEPVRRRPGMYIGGTGVEGLHHLVWEIFDNSRDEAMGGFADRIEVVMLPENCIRVADNGRGIPVDIHPKTKVSALETVMTTLHAGGKFGGEDSGYKVSGGLHGVGASVVNALSIYTKAIVHRDGGQYVQEYSQGKRKAAVKKVSASKMHGTIINFEPDYEIFNKDIGFSLETISQRLKQQAYLVKGMRITIIDAREADLKKLADMDDVFYFSELGIELPSTTYYFEGGLASLVKDLNKFQKPINDTIFYTNKEQDKVGVEIALQYVDDISDKIVPFANNIYTPGGGTHVTGFKMALTRLINTYSKKNNLLKESEGNFTGEDVLEGLTVVISVKLAEIQFEGQTKDKLGSTEAQGAVATVFGEAFEAFLEERPDEARAIINKSVLALKARKAAKAAKDSILRKGALEGMTLPGKLADCQTKDASESELFIVEGDSAGGCFSGDTKVALIDGRNLSFEELVKENNEGKRNFCYTTKDDGSIGVEEILYPRITKHNTEVIKVTLDNDEEIVCTPDHKFMLRDGTYTEAKNLSPKDSLMPLRRQISRLGKRITIKGYELAYDNTFHRWIFTHILSDSWNLAQGIYPISSGDVRHHIDFNKRNNNPTNLLRIPKFEHLMLHTRSLEKTLHRDDVKEKSRAIKKTKEFREMMSQRMKEPKTRAILSAQAKEQWQNPEYKKHMAEKYMEFYNTNDKYREMTLKRLDEEQKKYWNKGIHREEQSERVEKFFDDHPERKVLLSQTSKNQWNDDLLLKWRSVKTKGQWTPEFRLQRKNSYNVTYKEKALKTLRSIYDGVGIVDVEKYNALRKKTNDKSLLRFDTIASRFFGGSESKLKEAVVNYNHKVKSVEKISQRMDVYDIEVPNTHNFALASGVFVHNSSKQGRDRRTQAVLPLKGKILNVERARIDKMLASKEVKSLVIALGTSIGDTFEITRARYHKIIIATDADVDGAHIRTLLLTLFYRYFKQLIESGYIYIAQPPLYKIKKGKEISYAYSDEEKNKLIGKVEIQEIQEIETEEENPEATEEEVEEETKKRASKISIQRYKGLGEMNPEELWETTMDPARRVLKQVSIEDAESANKIFDTLMGSEVGPRKSFIQSHAKMAEIDI